MRSDEAVFSESLYRLIRYDTRIVPPSHNNSGDSLFASSIVRLVLYRTICIVNCTILKSLFFRISFLIKKDKTSANLIISLVLLLIFTKQLNFFVNLSSANWDLGTIMIHIC
jgi:hypothetical protein